MAVPLFVNWLTGQPTDIRNLSVPFTNAQDPQFGGTNDSTAIQKAINSLTNGGAVILPNAPAGFYAVTSPIIFPDTVPICLMGAGRGEGLGTVLKATTSISSVITTAVNGFVRGHRITNLTIDGNIQAQYCLQMKHAVAGAYDNLYLYNATTTNFQLGDGVHTTQENSLFAIRTDNPLITVLANQPTYNLEINGTNNDIVNVKCVNAKTANLHSSSTASGNKYVNVHGYDFFNGAAQPVTNNFLVDGSQEQFLNFECDGSGTANIQINGFGNIFAGGFSQFQGLAAQIGVQFANATSGNIVLGCGFANSTTANTIVQAGVAAAPGNFYFFNYNGTQAVIIANSALINNVLGNFGYSTGAGGTITQLTDKTTSVTLNTLTGQITMNAANLNAGATVSFTMNNTTVGSVDNIIINHVSGGTAGAYAITAQPFFHGVFIVIKNVSAGNLAEAIVLGFTIIRSVNS